MNYSKGFNVNTTVFRFSVSDRDSSNLFFPENFYLDSDDVQFSELKLDEDTKPEPSVRHGIHSYSGGVEHGYEKKFRVKTPQGTNEYHTTFSRAGSGPFGSFEKHGIKHPLDVSFGLDHRAGEGHASHYGINETGGSHEVFRHVKSHLGHLMTHPEASKEHPMFTFTAMNGGSSRHPTGYNTSRSDLYRSLAHMATKHAPYTAYEHKDPDSSRFVMVHNNHVPEFEKQAQTWLNNNRHYIPESAEHGFFKHGKDESGKRTATKMMPDPQPNHLTGVVEAHTPTVDTHLSASPPAHSFEPETPRVNPHENYLNYGVQGYHAPTMEERLTRRVEHVRQRQEVPTNERSGYRDSTQRTRRPAVPERQPVASSRGQQHFQFNERGQITYYSAFDAEQFSEDPRMRDGLLSSHGYDHWHGHDLPPKGRKEVYYHPMTNHTIHLYNNGSWLHKDDLDRTVREGVSGDELDDYLGGPVQGHVSQDHARQLMATRKGRL